MRGGRVCAKILVVFLLAGISAGEAYAKTILAAVPLLVGLDVSDPRATAPNLRDGNFHLIVRRREKSKKVPKGKIISQDPKAGAMARLNSAIKVVVSDGP